ncbi:MAG TPA: hypothetical protein VFD36_11190 [Kofleriaceae bacterium]|jgi:hypothetical protein|nr:hypothetical protein [Kofleriaceae bacterium]
MDAELAGQMINPAINASKLEIMSVKYAVADLIAVLLSPKPTVKLEQMACRE